MSNRFVHINVTWRRYGLTCLPLDVNIKTHSCYKLPYTDRLMDVKYWSRKSLAWRSTSSRDRGVPVLRVCRDTTLPRHACCEHWDGCGRKREKWLDGVWRQIPQQQVLSWSAPKLSCGDDWVRDDDDSSNNNNSIQITFIDVLNEESQRQLQNQHWSTKKIATKEASKKLLNKHF